MSNILKGVIVACLVVGIAIGGYAVLLSSTQSAEAAPMEYEDSSWGCIKACYREGGGDVQACIQRCNGKGQG
ncbi:MAG: hypothetical protein Q8Q20_01505 [bacterium]|nr:hypothetical protein [bacterium]